MAVVVAAAALVAFALVPAGVAAGQAVAPTPAGVRLPFPQDDGTLTPYTFELGYPLVTLIYDTLMWRDAHGVPQPWLATSVVTSADGMQVRISLAPGVRWQDGTALTSADVAFTFHYVQAHAHPRFTPELADVAGVDTDGALGVVVHLRQPSAGFADQPLADLPILPAHIWQSLPAGAVAPAGLPVGSGPYRLVDYQPKVSYRFEANADYFRGVPRIQTIEVPIVGDRAAMLRSFRSGGLDAVPETVTAAEAASVQGLSTRVETGASYAGVVLMFNLRQPPFDQVAVRRAVAEALDVDALASAAGGAVGADHGYLHPQAPLASTSVEHTYSPADARRPLAGIPGQPVTILAPDNEPAKLTAAQLIVQALGRVGLAATVKSLDQKKLAAAVGEDGTMPTFQAALWSSPALASYDPTLLGRLFGSSPGAGSLNYPGYDSPQFDALATQVAETTDTAARSAAVAREIDLLATDVPVVPLFFPAGIYPVHPAVYDGWTVVKGSGILDKLSFLGASTGGAAAPSAGASLPAAGGGGTGGGGGRSLLDYLFLGSAAGAVLLLVAIAGLRLRDRHPARR